MTLTAHRVSEGDWDEYARLFSAVFKRKTSAASLRRKLLTDFGAGPGAAFLVRDGQMAVASIGAQFLRFDSPDGGDGEVVVHVPGVSALKEYRGGAAVSVVFDAVETYARERGCRFAYGVAHGASLGPVTKLHGYQLTGTFDIFTAPAAGSSGLGSIGRRLRAAIGRSRSRMAVFRQGTSGLAQGNFAFEECTGQHDATFRLGLRERGAIATRIAGHDILVNPGTTLRVAALPTGPLEELAEIVRGLQRLAQRWGASDVQLMIEQRDPNHPVVTELFGPPRGSLFEVWKGLGDKAEVLPALRLCPAHTDHF